MQCPPEILSIIFDPVNVDKNEVVARGPLCSDLRCFYDVQLYRDIEITEACNWALLHQAIATNPHLGKLIRSFICTRVGFAPIKDAEFIDILDLEYEGSLVPVFENSSLLSSYVDGSWLSTVARCCTDLQKLSFIAFVTPTHSLAQLLEPLHSLPDLKSIQLTLYLPQFEAIHSPSISTVPSASSPPLPDHIDHLSLITDDFLHPQLLELTSRLHNLSSLAIQYSSSWRGPTIDLNPFLNSIDSTKLESLSFEFVEYYENELRYPSIDEFLSKCSKLRNLKVGLPILGSDITSLLRLERLELTRGAEVSFETIEEFLEAYDPNSRSVIKPFLLYLTGFTIGNPPEDTRIVYGSGPSIDALTHFNTLPSSRLDFNEIERMMLMSTIRHSEFTGTGYDWREAAELVELAEEKGMSGFDEMRAAIEVERGWDTMNHAEVLRLSELVESLKKSREDDPDY